MKKELKELLLIIRRNGSDFLKELLARAIIMERARSR